MLTLTRRRVMIITKPSDGSHCRTPPQAATMQPDQRSGPVVMKLVAQLRSVRSTVNGHRRKDEGIGAHLPMGQAEPACVAFLQDLAERSIR
jgi:hypothetical protein